MTDKVAGDEFPEVARPLCEDRVSAYPLRMAGGFPCDRPAKWIVRLGPREMAVCGIHKNALLREGGVAVTFPTTTSYTGDR